MKKTLLFFGFAAIAAVLSGCGSVNSALVNRHESVEMYHIFDVKTTASPDVVIKSLADGLGQNTNSVTQNRPLQMGVTIPDSPSRFVLVDPLAAMQGSGMGAFVAMAGGAGSSVAKIAKCDGAAWTSRAVREVTGSDALTLYTCLYRYKLGYQVNVYAVFNKTSGGVFGLTRDAVSSVIGTPEQWVTKTIKDTTRSLQAATGATVTYVEGQPAFTELPSVDRINNK